MSWNYRVVRRGQELAIHEVFYASERAIVGVTEEPVYPRAETLNDLAEELSRYRAALDAPVVSYDAIGAGSVESSAVSTRDEYQTCRETYVTLRVYAAADPAHVTRLLGIEPSDTQRAGEQRGRSHISVNGWFLSSRDSVASTDSSMHLEWLLNRIEPSEHVFHELRRSGATIDIACFWVSATGHGGPTLTAKLLGRLAQLSVDVWFDIYFDEL